MIKTIINIYLILYNILSCIGWSYILYKSIFCLINQYEILIYYQEISWILQIVQGAAVLEIFHSLFGFVRSPIFTTFIQVMSRLMILFLFTIPAGTAHHHYSLYLMVTSWSMVEVPRYMFYALNLIPSTSGSSMPYIIFWLRYSLFMILYPTGISGEILQQISTYSYYSRKEMDYVVRFSHILLILYVPFSPFMIWNMWINRKRAFKKRKEDLSPKKSDNSIGLLWPITDIKTGERSSTIINKNAWSTAIKSINEIAAKKIDKEKNWRSNYTKYVLEHVQGSCISSDAALTIAKSGLEYMYNTFEFVGPETDNKPMKFGDAMKLKPSKKFFTGIIKGNGSLPTSNKLIIPYKGQNLEGEQLLKQLDKWITNGTIEPSAADALKECMKNEQQWLDLSKRYFVLLGATSAMGPLDELLNLGANIIAIDIDRPAVWEKLITKARRSCGSLIFPLKIEQSECKTDKDLFANAGANLLADTPAISEWISNGAIPNGNSVTIGNYTYLDGALHVQLALACDSIINSLCKAHKNTSVAFLCTPTDDHLIPEEAVQHAKRNEANAPTWQKILSSMGFLTSNSRIPPINGLYVVDGIIVPQGPNYALAKRMQHWRAIIARNEGHIVSTNIAPSTNTVSVTSNVLFAAGYAGWKYFDALEVMEPQTSKASMCGIMMYDLNSEKSSGNPATKLQNPLQLMQYGSFHGGIWRAAWTGDSTGPVAVVLILSQRYSPIIVLGISLITSAISYIITGSPTAGYF